MLIIMDCIATMATKPCYDDIKLLLKSISIFSPNIKIYILGDSYICENCVIDYPNLNIITLCQLDKYTPYNRKQLEERNMMLDLTLEKCVIIDHALSENKNVLFLDADIILFNPIESIITEDQLQKDIGLSPHLIVKRDEDLYGKYNAVFIYISNKNVTSWWRKNSINSPFFEQKPMDDMPLCFNCFYFLPQNNFGWWRLLQAEKPLEIANKFTVKNNTILYDNLPLNSIHTHVISNFIYTVQFNEFIKKLIEVSKNEKLNFIFN
jgi:hypothetical protein